MSFYRLLFVGCLLLIGTVACSSEQPSNLQPLEVEPTIKTDENLEEVATTTQSPQIENTLAPVVVYDIATEEPLSATVKPQPTDPPTIASKVEPTEGVTVELVVEQSTEEVPTETPTPEVENGCRPLDQTLNFKNEFVVSAELPPHVPQSAVIYNGFGNGLKIIHLGFDVESSPEPLGDLLEVLDRRNVKATMFILGGWAEIYPNWIKSFADRGHEFANHAWSHADVASMDISVFENEVDSTEAFVQQLTGKSTKPFFRPPFGSWSEETVQSAYTKGYSTVLWTGSAEDWRPGSNAEIMCKTMMDNSYPGGIIYTHTWHPETAETIDRYIGEMQAQGYTFVPLSVILSDRPQDYLIPNN